MQNHRFDVVVVGAGATGAHAAGCLAESGLKVALVDRQASGQSGAQWVNGIPEWMYEEAGLGKPHPDEIFSEDQIFTMLAPSNKYRLSIRDFRLLDIDMRVLGNRLIDRVVQNPNTTVFFDTTVSDLELDESGRPRRALAHWNKEIVSLEASLFVDASGLPAVIRKNVPNLDRYCEAVSREDLCTAAQEVCEIKDRHGAGQFLQHNRASPGELLAWVSVVGGYSLMRVHIEHSLDRVAFLSGSRPLPDVPSGAKLIQDFKSKHAWVGPRIFGGQRALPLRRPYTDLVAPGVALIGDSACQVYSSHGSGVGIGLIAAKMLSDIVSASKSDIGNIESLFPYAASFHKRWGALLGASDALRRVSQRLSHEHIDYMMATGMMSHSMTLNSLLQRPIQLSLHEIPKQIKGSLQNLGLARKLSPLLWRLPFIATAPILYPHKIHRPSLDGHEKRMKSWVDGLSWK